MPHPKEQPFHHSYLDIRHEGTNNILMMFWYFEDQAKLSHLVKRMSVQPNYQESAKFRRKNNARTSMLQCSLLELWSANV